jgi:hypothetical protein
MKNKNFLKFGLLILLIFHILLSLIINFLSIENLKKKENIKFNIVGEFYKKIKFNIPIPFQVRHYAENTGINNGYGFYSPNLSNSIKEFNFYAKNKKLNNPFTTGESKMRQYTLMINFTDNIKNETVRKNIIATISKFYNNSNYNKVKVIVNIKLLYSINDYEKTKKRYKYKKIEAYIITIK